MGKLINIDSNNFEKLVENGKGNAVVQFSATWCGPCRQLTPIVEKMAEDHDDVQFFKVDIDESPNLTAKFGIVSVPTLISFKDGEKADTMVGAGNATTIEQNLASVF
ncbi:MAG: thioredoxin [Micrococcaceae bacterium]